MSFASLDTRPNLAPPTTFKVGKFGLVSLHQGEIICEQKWSDQSNCQGGLYTTMHRHYLLKVKSDCVFSTHCNSSLAWMPDELSPAHNFLGWEVRSGITPLRRNYLRTDIALPIKLSRQALYDDGQMINRNVINHVTNTRVEFIFNKHGCRWRAEIYRFESIQTLTVHSF